MQSHEGHRSNADPTALTPGERELEWALGSLRPEAPAGVDRSRALFNAGVAVGRQRARAWQGATGVMAAALLALLIIRMPAGDGGDGSARYVGPVVKAVESPSKQFPRATVAASETRMVLPPLPVMVATRAATNGSEYTLPPLTMPGERPGYLQLRDQVLQRGPDALRPADAAAPLWMANPAARRVLGPASVLKG